MPGTKRMRSDSACDEAAVSAYVETCTTFKSNVTFTDVATVSSVAPHVLLMGAPEQLKDKAVEALPFYCPAVAAALARVKAGATVKTLAQVAGHDALVSVTVTALPEKASRTNCPYRADSMTEAVVAACAGVGEGETLDVYVRAPAGSETAVANAVARGAPHSFTAKGGQSAKAYMKQSMTLNVVMSSRAAFTGEKVNGTAVSVAELEALCTSVQLCQRLVDTPTCLLDTVVYAEIAAAYAKELGADLTVLKGEELRDKGYGGIYAVGKGAEYPPHLVTLRYKNPNAGPAAKNVSLVGKGIVYDVGGLAIKSSSSTGMRADMGGSAGMFCAFVAVVRCMKAQKDHYTNIANLSVTLCMAENAIGPKSYRNDDVVVMKSGKATEVINTDAEGRLVLSDGVSYATGEQDFVPDEVVDMATLTGAQGVATGDLHAAIYTSEESIEGAMLRAGRASGDLCFPVFYCPEHHERQYASPLADMRNLMLKSGVAGSSCGGYFVEQNLHPRFKGPYTHVDMAYPVGNERGATGYGVSLMAQYLRDKY